MNTLHYSAGETPAIGDTVRHLVDSDTGTVSDLDYDRIGRMTITVEWVMEDGPYAHFADEVALITPVGYAS